jgi:hypothetical protein
VRTKNWIWGRSRTDHNGQLITSSSDVTSVIEKAKTLTAKEKTVNSSHSGRETNSAQPLRTRNMVAAHEQSLQLHRGRKGLRMKVIYTISVKHKRSHTMLKRHLHINSLIS